jgi:hypothetical protein
LCFFLVLYLATLRLPLLGSKDLLELTILPGLTAALVGNAAQVVLTDREEDMRPLRTTWEANQEVLNTVHLSSFDWNAPTAPAKVSHDADVILAVECVSADGQVLLLFHGVM